MTASAYDALVDRVIHHRVALSRYSTHVVRNVLSLLRTTEARVAEQIRSVDPESAKGMRLERLLDDVRETMRGGYDVVNTRVLGDLAGLTRTESAWAASTVASTGAHVVVSDVPAVAQIFAASQARPFQGKLLREWLSDLEGNAAARVRGAIRQGFVEGQGPAEIARTIRGTAALGYRDGIMDISRRGAEAMVRTAITHTASFAAETTYEAFGDVVEAVRFCAVLDSRTSIQCISLNGKVFTKGKGPRPPIHINCRSTLVPEIKGLPSTGFPTYEEFLKRQSTEQQNDILGPSRARLWRRGGVELGAFADRKGQVYTLAQLQERNASAFHKAGLN